MSERRAGSVARQFRALLDGSAPAGRTDGQLLERFAAGPGEAAERAFAALVERHGPLVLAVCRAVLGDEHDAQDAAQATFLALARKGRRLWVRDSLAPWLHAAAWRAAGSARAARARRRRHEHAVAAAAGRTPFAPEPPADRADLAAALHEEVDHLPGRYREPVVLCDLQGRPLAHAARALGVPLGTIKSRLARARLRLRDRLARRGLAPAVLLRAVLPPPPTAWVAAAVAAAVGRGGPAGLLPGVLAMIVENKLRTLVGMLVVGAGVAAGVGLAARGGRAGPALSQDDPNPPAATAAPAQEPAVAVGVAQRGAFEIASTVEGLVGASRSEELRSPLETPTTLLSIVPDGTRVKEGDLVAQLDDAALRDMLTNQEIKAAQARLEMDVAHTAVQAAEGAVEEFEEGEANLARRELQDAMRLAAAEMQIAEMERKKAQDTGADPIALARAELALQRADAERGQAGTKLEVLQQFTIPRRLGELRVVAERAKAEALLREAVAKLEGAKREKLAQQVAACKITAPFAGIVQHGGGGLPLAPEVTVPARRFLASVIDVDSPATVELMAREAWVDRIETGQPIRVRFPDLDGREVGGKVESVAPRPEIRTGGKFKLYRVRVRLDQPDPTLRPGMAAEARFVLQRIEDALAVPASALVERDGKPGLLVRDKDGATFTWRAVTLGPSDEQRVAITDGLAPGETYALLPATLNPAARR